MKIELIEPIVKVVELPTAPPTSLSIGTVTTLAPGDPVTAAIRGLPPSQILDLGIPQGDQGVPGPANTLAIGTVVEGPVADAVISGTAPSQTLSLMLPQADPGPPNTLAIGTVVEGPTAGATITGTSPSQTLNLVLPEADPGPPNTLTIGTVGSGAAPAATITGTSPNQTLNLTLVPGIGVPTTGNQTGDLLRWNGSVWIQTATKFHEGTGNPNGVVTAPVGSTFVNTETGGFNGARRWTKATGSGSTGWVVVDGDTGRVEVPDAWLGAGWERYAPTITLSFQRVVNVIYVTGFVKRDATASATTSATIFTLPPSFRGQKPETGPLFTLAAPTTNNLVKVAAYDGLVQVQSPSSTTPSTTYRLPTLIFPISTTISWPSTLP